MIPLILVYRKHCLLQENGCHFWKYTRTFPGSYSSGQKHIKCKHKSDFYSEQVSWELRVTPKIRWQKYMTKIYLLVWQARSGKKSYKEWKMQRHSSHLIFFFRKPKGEGKWERNRELWWNGENVPQLFSLCFQMQIWCRDDWNPWGLQESGQPTAPSLSPPYLIDTTMCEASICVIEVRELGFLRHSLFKRKLIFLRYPSYNHHELFCFHQYFIGVLLENQVFGMPE